jgi:hypothetical protein
LSSSRPFPSANYTHQSTERKKQKQSRPQEVDPGMLLQIIILFAAHLSVGLKVEMYL